MATLESQLMSISEMDQLINLITHVESVDAFGSISYSTTTLASNIRAKVRYERTQEQEDANRKGFVQEIKIWIRYYSGLNKTHRVTWNSQEWEIYAIETTPRDRFHILKCREVTR